MPIKSSWLDGRLSVDRQKFPCGDYFLGMATFVIQKFHRGRRIWTGTVDVRLVAFVFRGNCVVRRVDQILVLGGELVVSLLIEAFEYNDGWNVLDFGKFYIESCL